MDELAAIVFDGPPAGWAERLVRVVKVSAALDGEAVLSKDEERRFIEAVARMDTRPEAA